MTDYNGGRNQLPATIEIDGYTIPNYTPPRLMQRELQHPTDGENWFTYANETELAGFSPYLDGLSGALVGVGPDQVLDLFANTQVGISHAVLVDYVEQTSLRSVMDMEVGLFLRYALGRNPTSDELINFFDEGNIGIIQEVLARSLDDHELETVTRMLTIGVEIHGSVMDPMRRFSYADYLRAKREIRRPDGKPFAWHATEEGIDKVLSAYAEGRITVIHGDISEPETMRTVRGVLDNAGVKVAGLYLSNAEGYLSDADSTRHPDDTSPSAIRRFGEAVVALSYAADAVILRTTQPYGLVTAAPKSAQVRANWLLDHVTFNFHYDVQTMDDWYTKVLADLAYADGGWKTDVETLVATGQLRPGEVSFLH